MSQVKAMRRAVAKIRHEEAADAIPHVGHKQVHHFWPLLSTCFRDVLVAPHHRTDEDAVTWTWRESEDAAPPSAAELAELRRRLGEAMEHFSQDVAAGRVGRGEGSATPGQIGNVEQLEAVMVAMVKELAGRPDAELKRFVCRAEYGLRLHSWGAGAPARPTYPETRGLEISGRVLVAGKPARHDVVLESSDGETIAEVPSDEEGEFSFSKLSPGEYRLRARSVRGTFPPHGLPVDLQQRSVKGLVLADTRADAVSPLVSARRAAGRRSRRTLPVLVLAVVALAAGGWLWRGGSEPARPVPPPTVSRGIEAASGDVASPAGRSMAVRSDDPVGTSPASSPGVPGGGSTLSGAALPPQAATERREVPAEGRAVDPGVLLPNSGGGSSGGGGTLPPAGGARGGSAVAAGAVSTESVHLSAPAASPPVIDSDRGAPAGRPAVTAASGAASPAGPGERPAPGAPFPGSATSSASGSGAGAVAGSPVVALRTEVPPDVTVLAPAKAPVEPLVSPPSAPVAAAAEADVATPPAENARASAETSALLVSAAVSRRDEASVPAAPVPVATPESSAAPVPQMSAAPAPVGLPSGIARAAPEPMTRTVRVRVSPWRVRLLADTILPTEPIPLATPEPVAVLRARLLAEKEARLPQAMREPAARWGVALELDAGDADETLTWLDADGGQPEGAGVKGGRAEILWAPAAEGGERQFRLSRRDGSFVAEVGVAAHGRDFTVRTREETRAWLLLAVGVGPSRRPALDAGGEAKPFAWRYGTADALPPGWRERNVDELSSEAIAEAPLGSVPGAAALQSGVLFDPETGWAIVADIRQAADRPLGN